jgi:hypothetical protein
MVICGRWPGTPSGSSRNEAHPAPRARGRSAANRLATQRGRIVPRVRVQSFAISIDGYGAGPSQDLQHPLGVNGPELMEWFFTPPLAADARAAGRRDRHRQRDDGGAELCRRRGLDSRAQHVGPVRGPPAAVTDEWIRRLLRREGLTTQRVRTWKTSSDPAFDPKKRIRRLYRRGPADAAVVCFDEWGPLELRPIGGVTWALPRRPARMRATYRRPTGPSSSWASMMSMPNASMACSVAGSAWRRSARPSVACGPATRAGDSS